MVETCPTIKWSSMAGDPLAFVICNYVNNKLIKLSLLYVIIIFL